jgi:DNA polymerase III subunit delta
VGQVPPSHLAHTSLVQSLSVSHFFPTLHLGQTPPPQSVSVSVPSFMPSVQLVTHTSFRQTWLSAASHWAVSKHVCPPVPLPPVPPPVLLLLWALLPLPFPPPVPAGVKISSPTLHPEPAAQAASATTRAAFTHAALRPRMAEQLDANAARAQCRSVTPEDAIAEAAAGKLRPVYLILGEERLLVDRVVFALREAVGKGGVAGFNEDKFTAGEAQIGAILGASRMIPMMAPRRFVLVRGLDRWEKKEGDEDKPEKADKPGKKGRPEASPLDELADYTKDPPPTTVMVLVSPKLHGQRRLVAAAKKGGFLVSCEPLSREALPRWIEKAAQGRGHRIAPEVAELLAEIAGPELGYVDDAVERLSLYAGPGAAITEDAVAAVVTRVRQSSVWELLDALGRRSTAGALAILADVFDPRDGGLRLLGAVAWSVRQLVKFDSAMRSGADPREAAQRAGMPPFKANDAARTVRAVPPGTLPAWLGLLAETDLALKSSRRPAQAVLEAMLIEMCR